MGRRLHAAFTFQTHWFGHMIENGNVQSYAFTAHRTHDGYSAQYCCVGADSFWVCLRLHNRRPPYSKPSKPVSGDGNYILLIFAADLSLCKLRVLE